MCSEKSISRHLQTALRCLPLCHLNALPCLSSALTTACGAETSRDRLPPPPPKRLPASGPQECCNLISQAVKAFIVSATSRFKSRSRVMHDSYVFTALYLFKSHRRHSLQVHHQTSLPLRKSLHTALGNHLIGSRNLLLAKWSKKIICNPSISCLPPFLESL